MRYYYKTTRMAKIKGKKAYNTKHWQRCLETGTLHFLVRMQNGTTTSEISLTISYKIINISNMTQ